MAACEIGHKARAPAYNEMSLHENYESNLSDKLSLHEILGCLAGRFFSGRFLRSVAEICKTRLRKFSQFCVFPRERAFTRDTQTAAKPAKRIRNPLLYPAELRALFPGLSPVEHCDTVCPRRKPPIGSKPRLNSFIDISSRDDITFAHSDKAVKFGRLLAPPIAQ
jgi:hypothetical protein